MKVRNIRKHNKVRLDWLNKKEYFWDISWGNLGVPDYKKEFIIRLRCLRKKKKVLLSQSQVKKVRFKTKKSKG